MDSFMVMKNDRELALHQGTILKVNRTHGGNILDF
jgi:hypothetical protein